MNKNTKLVLDNMMSKFTLDIFVHQDLFTTKLDDHANHRRTKWYNMFDHVALSN